MPPHIRKHCTTVAAVALYLTGSLNGGPAPLNRDLVEAGALLHDIAKGKCIGTDEDHARLGGTMVRQWGYEAVAPIVEAHVFFDESLLHGPITESVLVNYADKRVRHDEIVTLEDRFADLMERYGKTPAHIGKMKKMLEVSRRLEEKIFDGLSIGPADLSPGAMEL